MSQSAIYFQLRNFSASEPIASAFALCPTFGNSLTLNSGPAYAAEKFMQIEQFPDLDFLCQDDSSIADIAVKLGVFNALGPPWPDPWGHIGIDTDCKTHWLYFLRFYGFPDAHDNGYTLYAFAKSAHTRDWFEAERLQIAKRHLCEAIRTNSSRPLFDG